MKRLAKIILPHKANFYKLLHNQAEKTAEGMEALADFMKTKDWLYAEKVNELEKEADMKRRLLLDELDKTFITPFEREDIYNLSKAIDDIIDYGDSTVDEMKIFNIEPTDELLEIAEVLHEVAVSISDAVKNMENNRDLAWEYSAKVKALENHVEYLYRNSLVSLFENDDVKYILKMREIYRHLSNCADKGDLAADAIGHILVKIS